MCLVVQRVEVAGGVIAGLPVEVELEFLGAFKNLLLLFLRAEVLRLDQRQFFLALPFLSTRKHSPPAATWSCLAQTA